MKVISKLFVVALLFSLTLTICTVAAADDVTFSQSNLTIETNNNEDTASVSKEVDDENDNNASLKSSCGIGQSELLRNGSGHDNYSNNTPQEPYITHCVFKHPSEITAEKKTFKNSKKVKKYSITLKSIKSPIKNAKVTLKINKKTYKAKTNNHGKATFKIKNLSKKGKYKGTVIFHGNAAYRQAAKKVIIRIK